MKIFNVRHRAISGLASANIVVMTASHCRRSQEYRVGAGADDLSERVAERLHG